MQWQGCLCGPVGHAQGQYFFTGKVKFTPFHAQNSCHDTGTAKS